MRRILINIPKHPVLPRKGVVPHLINVIMTEEIIKIGTDKKMEIEFNLVDKVEVDQGMSRIIEMIIREEILEIM